MDEDWVKKLLTIMIGSIVLFTILICQTQEIEKNLIGDLAGQETIKQETEKKQEEEDVQQT